MSFSRKTLSAREMINWTAEGVGRERDPGDRRIEIHVDHVFRDIATATGTSAIYVDYLQLARTRDGWKIVNVLWDRVVQTRADRSFPQYSSHTSTRVVGRGRSVQWLSS